MTPPLPAPMDRRRAIGWMLAATASLTVRPNLSAGQTAAPAGKGYGTDPDLLKTYASGELWPLTFDARQSRAAAALCDVIIPADGTVPAASSLHVHEFIDEWISAPYPDQQKDRPVVIDGLAWIDAEAGRRFKKDFADLDAAQQTAICDDICFLPKAGKRFQTAARFFAKFRDLTAGGFYTTPEGMKDIGYTGNLPSQTFDGPPQEVLKQLGLV
jgi:hypothetical protein